MVSDAVSVVVSVSSRVSVDQQPTSRALAITAVTPVRNSVFMTGLSVVTRYQVVVCRKWDLRTRRANENTASNTSARAITSSEPPIISP